VTAAPRPDALPPDLVAKVTGAARFATDLEPADLTHAALVRSDVPHGLLRAVDVSAGLEVAGVVCVLTAADVADIDR
jgi:CO/xanthine dehydrogenase Mo-binding subunit